MKKIILFLILIIFLSGCGIYNLNTFVLPDDAEFLALIQELDTPEKICQYMLDNFESEIHLSYDLTPYQLFIIQKGDCQDMFIFAQFIANFHGHETYHAFIKFPDFSHSIVIYREDSYYSFSDNQYYIYAKCDTFKDIIDLDNFYFIPHSTWSSYEVYDYENNLIEKEQK